MFDIGFLELALILVVALLVVGPQRLPGLVRTAGHWAGKLRTMVNAVQTEVKREIHNAEILQRELEEKITHETSLTSDHKPESIDLASPVSKQSHGDEKT